MRREHGGAALALVVALACAPASSERRVASAPLRVVAAPSAAPSVGGALASDAVLPEPRAAASGASSTALAVAFTPFGRVIAFDEKRPLWSLPPIPRRTDIKPARYERWHERARATVGHGYLSILDLTLDERALLVVSEEEAKLRVYDYPSLKLTSSVPVDGYRQSVTDFVFAPFVGAPAVVFAGQSGVVLLDPGTSRSLPLAQQPADGLRFTDDHAVLGAVSSFLPAQRWRLVFYVFTAPTVLEPLLVMDFAERVEEWDLDSTKRRLAVTYYPSNQTELIDLASRKILWTAPAPEFANSVDISPDDSRVAVGGSSVVLHDPATGAVIASDAHFGNNIHRVRFSPGGDALAVSSYEGKIRLFDATAKGPELPLRRVLRHSGTANVYALVFTKDGSALVSGSGDRTVRIWGE